MGIYQPLFTVRVGHSYFSSGEWRGLDFVPTADTAKMMKGADVLAKPTGSGVALFYDQDRARTLRLYAEGADPALPFRFKVYCGDKTFANYTAPTSGDPDAILCFDNRAGMADPGSGACRLSKDAFVSDKDLRDMGELIAGGILTEADRRAPPDFVVEVLVKPGPANDDGSPAAWPSQNCYCNFAARSSLWRYFLLGNLGGSSAAIVDPDNRVVFEQRGEVLLAGNRPAKVFRSKDAIPLQETPTCRFQLKTQGNGGARVLIKRLPAASKNRLGMDEIDGKKEIVFENYINF
ncbi:MAG TPA: hypothetical protein VF472_23025 [Burkholderiaceae bacterium]